MSNGSTTPGQTTPSVRQDRLLQSEVKELQGKVASLEKENYELKQQLSKYIGMDMNLVRRHRQVGSALSNLNFKKHSVMLGRYFYMYMYVFIKNYVYCTCTCITMCILIVHVFCLYVIVLFVHACVYIMYKQVLCLYISLTPNHRSH